MTKRSRRYPTCIPLVLLGGSFVSCSNTGYHAAQGPVRISQFYATKQAVPRGEEVLLCYGVENAVAVRLVPPVEEIKPALSRCFNVSPLETTSFTLVAEDLLTKAISQPITVTVTPPRPHFSDLSISAKAVAPGQLVAFCFQAKSAVAVSGSPGYFHRGGSPKSDCLLDYPRETTSYRIRIEGGGGQIDDAKVTVRVH